MKTQTPRKFPRTHFWRNIRFLTLFFGMGILFHLFLTQYADILIPSSVPTYIAYAVLALILFIMMVIFSLRLLGPYRKLLKQLEELPLDLAQDQKLLAIYKEKDFSSLNRAIKSHQDLIQKRVNNIDDQNQKLDSLVNSFPFPIISLDKDKNIVFYNYKALQLYPKLESITAANDLFAQDLLLKVNECILQATSTSLPFKKLEAAENNLLYRVEISPLKSPLSSESIGSLLVFLSSDNTKAIETIRNDLLKGISLNIISPIRELEEVDLPDETRSILQSAKLRAESFHELFEMAASDWESIQEFNLKEALTSIFELYKQRYPNKTVTIDDSMLKVTKLKVYPELFQTALKNIISNCFKYGRDHIAINIKSYVDDDHLYLSISDNGSGIAPDQVEGIFEYFYQQALLGQTPPDGKLSIGLAIIKSAIFHHRGRVAILSSKGCGTTIRIQLPYSCKG